MSNPSEHQAYPLNKSSENSKSIAVDVGEAPENKKLVDKGMKTPGKFPCSICDYVAKTEQGLKVHMTRSHPELKSEGESLEAPVEIKETKNEEEKQEVQEPTKEEVEEKVKTIKISVETPGVESETK